MEDPTKNGLVPSKSKRRIHKLEAALDSVLLRKHLVKNLSALAAWQSTAVLKARTSKPYVCTSFATDTTGKGDQELFLFKPYSEILSKAGSEQSFFLDHGILNPIFCMYSFAGTSYFFNIFDYGD